MRRQQNDRLRFKDGNNAIYSSMDNEVVISEKETSTPNSTISVENSNQSSNSTKANVNKSRYKFSPHWTTWSNWSTCTRSCGTGVMSQQRKCVTRYVLYFYISLIEIV